MLNSRIAEGLLRHRRAAPIRHRFEYALSMMLIDLDELEALARMSRLWSIDRRNLVELRGSDYLPGVREAQISLKEAVYRTIDEKTGQRFRGNVWMLTNPRYWGFCFNPVTFYFCFLEQPQDPEFIVADIHNTPWNQHYQYVLPREQGLPSPNGLLFEFPKHFHVSPFMPMDIEYAWRFSLGIERITIHMDLFQQSHKLFDATLRLTLRPVNASALNLLPLKYALMCHRVLWRIYWNAFRLWLKRTPFFAHPDSP